jgi:hypothetical protein
MDLFRLRNRLRLLLPDALRDKPLTPEQVQDAWDTLKIENGDTETVETWINERTILALFGPVDGEALLQALATAATQQPVLQRILRWMQPSEQGIDVGHTATRAMIDSLTDGVISDEQAATLKALAERRPLLWPGLTVDHINTAWSIPDANDSQ